MKVLDLRCSQDHRFEGWFDSDDDWSSQRERALLECPLCGDGRIERLPSAPRLNLSSVAAPPAAAGGGRAEDVVNPVSQAQARWLRSLREVIERTEDVGERFAEEARRIHYGEAAHRGIRGRASREQSDALRDEGIEVMPLPMPQAFKEPLQ